MKNILLIGAGGVGTIVALSLTMSEKVDVTMVVRSDYDKVSKDGYNIDSVDFGHIKNWKPKHIVKSVDEAAKIAKFDYIFVCTKNIPEVQDIAEVIAPAVSKGTSIALIQNGIGNEAPVAARFPEAYVIGGVSMIGSANYNGEIKQNGPDEITFGTFDERPEAIAAAKEIAQIYDTKSKGIFTEELQYKRWVKLVYNSCYNTICALTGLDVGRLFFANASGNVVTDAMKEVVAIAEADLGGRKLPEGIVDFMLASDGGVFYEPSMQVDVKKGQPMELEVILGNTLRYAAKHNVPAPTLKVVYQLLRCVQFRILEERGKFKLPSPKYSRATDKPVWDSLPWTE